MRRRKLRILSLTKVRDRADLAGYLFFRIFPHAIQEVHDEMDGLLSGLRKGALAHTIVGADFLTGKGGNRGSTVV